jgi:hypothetical protein
VDTPANRALLPVPGGHLVARDERRALRGQQVAGLTVRRLGARGRVVGAGLDGLGNRDDEAPVPIQDLPRVDDGQANDLLRTRREA